jgi:hypothetical protein
MPLPLIAINAFTFARFAALKQLSLVDSPVLIPPTTAIMKNTLLTQSRSTGRLRAAFSFCRHGLLVLSSLAVLSAQAGDSQSDETVTIGGNIPVLSTPNFGTTASVTTQLTATTVITGVVEPGYTTDKISFTLATGYKINSANVFVASYVAAGGTPDTGPRVLFKNGNTTYGSVAFSGTGNNTVQFTSQVPAGQFDLQITAPSGLQSGGMFAQSFVSNVGPGTPTVTYGSANYVITLNISRTTVPLTQLAGNYIGLVNSNVKLAAAPPSRIANIVNPPPSPFKPIPNEALNARLEMMISTTGGVTGSMTFGPTRVAFTGAFYAPNGKTLPEIVISIPAFNRQLALRFDTDEDRLGYFQGSLIQQGSEVFYDEGIFGWKNTWTPTKLPTTDMTSYKTFSLNSGRNIGIIVKAESMGPVGRGFAPQGSGFGTVTAGATAGTYTVAGTLADGEKITTNGFYGPRGDVLIYQYLYASRGKGSFAGNAGLMNMTQGPPKQELDVAVIPQLSGFFSWIKQPSPLTQARSGPPKRFGRAAAASSVASDTLYPEGFNAGVFLRGATYTPPAAGQVLGVRISSLRRITGVNTGIFFNSDLGVGSESIAGNLSISSPGSTSRVNSVSPSGFGGIGGPGQAYSGLTFQTFNVTTGYFSGRYNVTPPMRSVTFEGMMVYDPYGPYYQGFGYYLTRTFGAGGVSQQRASGSVYIGQDDD